MQHVVRYALRHRVLAVINILSVALGVSVYLAVQIANRSATAAFRAGIDVVAGRANIEVRGTLDDILFPKAAKNIRRHGGDSIGGAPRDIAELVG